MSERKLTKLDTIAGYQSYGDCHEAKNCDEEVKRFHILSAVQQETRRISSPGVLYYYSQVIMH